jgi:hypothetical protein
MNAMWALLTVTAIETVKRAYIYALVKLRCVDRRV